MRAMQQSLLRDDRVCCCGWWRSVVGRKEIVEWVFLWSHSSSGHITREGHYLIASLLGGDFGSGHKNTNTPPLGVICCLSSDFES